MKLSDLVTLIREEIDQTDTSNTKWTDAQIRARINRVGQRLHRRMAKSVPELFRTTLDITVPANVNEVAIPWPYRGAPQVLNPIYDITAGTPGVELPVIDRGLDPHGDGVGVVGKTFYTLDQFSSARTVRLIVVIPYVNVTDDDEEIDDMVPQDYQEDLFVYGTALDLYSAAPSEAVGLWSQRYQQAEKELLKFLRNQTRFQKPRYGDSYILKRRWSIHHVR